jgi:hypothetical protein
MAIPIPASIHPSFKHPLSGLRDSNWYFEFIEIHDLRLCDKATLELAYAEAPTRAAQAYIYAIVELRQALGEFKTIIPSNSIDTMVDEAAFA